MKAWLDVLGCPICLGTLVPHGEAGLECITCATQYPVAGGIPSLVRPGDRARLAAWSHGYQLARKADGWCPLSREAALGLPFVSPPGYPALYWQVRRQSFRALLRLLAQEGPRPEAGPVADLGAGNGWLSYRLTRRGYRVVAVDVNADAPFGLAGASPYVEAGYPFLRVQGDLEHLPLRPGRLSLIVLNASLHYCEKLGATLQRAADAVQAGGALIVLDTPTSRRPAAGTGRGDRHLGRDQLDQGLRAAGLRPAWHTVWRGPRWWLHQAASWLGRRQLFWFPVVAAVKGRNSAQ